MQKRKGPKVKRNDCLAQILLLQEQAAGLAEQVRGELKVATPTERLVPLLQEQSSALAKILECLVELREDRAARSAEERDAVTRAQDSVRMLAETAEENYRLAVRNGIRLPGIGGRPRAPSPLRPGPRT